MLLFIDCFGKRLKIFLGGCIQRRKEHRRLIFAEFINQCRFTDTAPAVNYKAFKSTPCIPLIHIAEFFFSAIKHKSTSLQTYELLTYEFIIHCFWGIVKRICCKTFMFKYEKAPPKRRLLYAAFCSVFFSLSQSAVFLFNPWRFRIAYSSASLSPTNISLCFARVIAV